MSDFEKIKEELPSKEKIFISLIDRKVSGKKYEHAVNVWKKNWNDNDEKLAQIVSKI